MIAAVTAARTILTRLHDVMASRSNAQAKLNTVVEVIGAGLDSEVCSVYLLREGMLELFATRGLSQEAVHVTRMGVGEGLVGTIAQSIEMLNLAEWVGEWNDYRGSFRWQKLQGGDHSALGDCIATLETIRKMAANG